MSEKTLGPHEYRCDACRGVFDKGWTDEEANAEAQALFQQQPDTHHMAQVCDDCWREMMGLPPASQDRPGPR